MKKSLALTLTTLAFTGLLSSASADYKKDGSYCAAIRGNGELMPAHWGSMARLVERYGVPAGMSGGSSASITMFLMESIALNPIVKNNTQRALLIKSIEGYFETLTQTSEGKALISLLKDKAAISQLVQKIAASQGQLDGATSAEVTAFQLKHMQDIQAVMQSSDLKEILNPEMLQYIQQTIGMSKVLQETKNPSLKKQVDYRYGQIEQAFKNFGKFSTTTDNTLFFRPGIISFEKVAKLFGRMANFYASYDLGKDNQVKASVDAMMTQFLSACSADSKGKSWQEIVARAPVCRQMLGKSILDYRNETKKLELAGTQLKRRVEENIGKHISTFPTTSVIIKKGVTRYQKAHAAYQTTTDKNFGENFKIHPTQYRFGYWGNTKELKQIKSNLKNKSGFTDARGIKVNLSKDKKSSKFLSLGSASWLTALSTSPAEPGLARILPIKNRTDILSAGGWDDLHPTMVLRAAGCKNIIYVTRRGGDSMFGQGVVRKLTRIGGFDWQEWEGLTAEQKREKNARGDKDDVGKKASSWSKLYNLANPESSFSKSLTLADAVWCTNWDQQNVKTGIPAVVADGYNAPLYNGSNNQFFKSANGLTKADYESQLLKASDIPAGSLEFAGCVPN
ncbi:MAG: hypothetical protein HN509_09535 [Halobacteriovoraceae bacterium]|jgi:hypothetical protein|nr:hypothetical protein [Halobacteriovoraceae bacterium]MBT5094881.1 hypothetical protein [Halobacteriovoraceae bacterium]